VESLSAEAVETDVKLALRRPGGVVFPAWATELGDALHGDDQLESHRGGSDIQRRSISGLLLATMRQSSSISLSRIRTADSLLTIPSSWLIMLVVPPRGGPAPP
jgi:hypothetical protein